MDRKKLLRSVPLFDSLNSQELREIGDLFREVSRLKGDTVCREGEAGDTLYILLSGELEVWTGSEEDKHIINRMGPGDFFGEVAILTGQTRSATVTASRDARLWIIDRHTFETFIGKNSKLLEHLSKVMAQRLVRVSRGEITARAATVVSVIGPPGTKGKSLTASALAGLLGDFTHRPAIHVAFRILPKGRKGGKLPRLTDLEGRTETVIRGHVKDQPEGPAFLEIGVDKRTAADAIRPSVGTLVEALNETFSVILLEPSGGEKSLISSVVACSDFVICIEGSEAFEIGNGRNRSARLIPLINRFNQGSRRTPINRVEPFVLPVDPELDTLDPIAQSRYIRQHPRSSIGLPLHRLARRILGTTVGIALGGGAAFGIAHIGVLKTLEENEVPVDLIAGTSMGSIVALGYAAGLSGSEMTDIAVRLGIRRKTLSALDFTLNRPGLLKGNRLIEIFSPLLPERAETFEDLRLPCRTVAADIESGERVTIESGPLDMAFRASCSVPLVISPVSYQGRTLVDGAVVDPVPAEVVRDMGADVCIAVNVVPQLQKGVDTVLSRFYRHANRLNPLSYLNKGPLLPNLFDILMNTIQTLQYELGNLKAISADVRINPDLSGYTWMEFYKPMELIEKGANAAEQALPEIRRILAERLSATYT